MTTTVKTTGVLFPDGSLQTSASPPSTSLSYTLYTSGSNNWTCPEGITKVLAIVIGGGGGGGSSNDGGFGGYAIGVVSGLTPGGSYTATVGAGGAAGVSGGTSSFIDAITATGGAHSGGADGAGSGGNFSNGITNTNGFFAQSLRIRPEGSGASAVAYSTSGAYVPGSAGGDIGGTAAGGVGGAVLLIYL